MKKILIIHTGGTFGMVPQKPSQTLAPNQVQESILKYVPEIGQIADIDFVALFNLDSANITPTHWQGLAQKIAAELDHYDGFVVIHGTDSMTYTAAALSFMLRHLPKPVILTGSQRPLAEIRSDARMNLINAVELATYPIPEVCIFFGTELLRGNRAIKLSGIDYGAFQSPNYPPLADVGLDITIHEHVLRPTAPFELKTAVSDEVLALPFFPGLHPEYLRWVIDSPIKALVIQALGLGNVATRDKSLVPLVQALTAAGKIVVITSQSRHGYVDLQRYENGKQIAEAGAIGAQDMTNETTIVKLMHLLGLYPNDPEHVKKILQTPIAGEIDPQT
jgi:L-asparaginase